MEIVQRILSKIVGAQISVEEQELVSGGRISLCDGTEAYNTMLLNSEICDE